MIRSPVPAETLPATLTALRARIAPGLLTPEDAIARQRAMLAHDRWHCLTHVFAPVSAASAALPLAGIGLAHKDIFAMGDRQPQCGTPWAMEAGGTRSPAVRRLEAAGASTLAALTMAEFACGATGENPHLPRPVNPVDPAAAVGGSSSGCAVAVAAGLCYGALGTDTAGSVRIPAATCGVFGFKPGTGVISTAGAHPLAPSLDTVGLLTRSVEDARVLFDVLRSARSARPLAQPQAWRIALALRHPRWGDPAPEIIDTLHAFARDMGGEDVHDRVLDELPALTRAAEIVMHVEAADIHAQALRTGRPPLGPLTRAVVLPGSTLPAPWYSQVRREQDAQRRRFVARHLRGRDILLTPMLAQGVPDWTAVDTASPAFTPKALLGLFAWTGFVNYLGLPAASLPIGTDTRGRPISVQAIARPGHERLLLAFAAEAELRCYGKAGFVPTPPALRTALPA